MSSINCYIVSYRFRVYLEWVYQNGEENICTCYRKLIAQYDSSDKATQLIDPLDSIVVVRNKPLKDTTTSTNPLTTTPITIFGCFWLLQTVPFDYIISVAKITRIQIEAMNKPTVEDPSVITFFPDH